MSISARQLWLQTNCFLGFIPVQFETGGEAAATAISHYYRLLISTNCSFKNLAETHMDEQEQLAV
jgi:hypothetical protein